MSEPADAPIPDLVVERPKDRSHGDFSTNVAMLLAKPARSNPRALTQALLPALQGRRIARYRLARAARIAPDSAVIATFRGLRKIASSREPLSRPAP